VLAVAPFVGGDDDAVDVTTASAATESGTDVVRTASLGSPSEVRELLSETTTTLVEATGATTSTTGVPATSTPSTASAPAEDDDAAADGDEVAAATTTTTEDTSVRAQQVESSTTSAAPTTTAAPARKTTPTTAAPRPAPTTTAAPTTTTPPPAPKESSGEGYAYDDPRSTQVWYDLAECESGGNWSINTGNGYYGGLQFSLPTWESVGGPGYPHEHPAATQIDFGRTLQARQGWGAWPHCSEKLGLR
jgi:hypothetical protein